MFKPATLLAALLALQLQAQAQVTPHPYDFVLPAKDAPEFAWWRQSMETRDQRLAWWRDARFGMFIHWGVYSELAGEWHGKLVPGYAEHIMRKEKIPRATYLFEVAGQFNPVHFNADDWVRTAKEAGMGYLVITAKHHDGFAMYDSAVSDFNIVKATPWHHDPMADLRAACDKYGVKFGFYYSHAFDWEHPDAPGNDWDYDNPGGDKNLHGGRDWWLAYPEFLPRARHYVDTKAIPQLKELIAKYHPDIFWFDTPHKLPPEENYRILRAVRAADPNVVVNGRLLRGYGDYDSTADRPAEFSPHDGDWEGIPTTNESYGYHKGDHSHKPPAHFIQLLAKAAARGGNLLMNIGPMGDGQFAPEDVTILHGIAAWMKNNGDSIHGTTRTPLPVQPWGESTRKGNKLYLHVFNWPTSGTLTVGGIKSPVAKAYLLADPSQTPLASSRNSDLDLSITLPAAAPDPTDSIIVLECATDNIASDPNRPLSTSQQNILRGLDATLEGSGLKYGAGKRQDAFVMDWKSKDQSVVWPVRITEPGDFDLAITYDADPAAAGGIFNVSVGKNDAIVGKIQAEKEHFHPLGRVHLDPGTFEIRIRATDVRNGQFLKLRNLSLTPVAR